MHNRFYKPLPTRAHFYRRLARSIAIGVTLILFSLFIGMWGYHWFEGMAWLDAFLNASMILAGMGPVGDLHTSSGKLFAGCYAIFSGVLFLSMAAVIMAPVVHRFLHRMHLDIESQPEQKP
jgi:hypothetical protein